MAQRDFGTTTIPRCRKDGKLDLLEREPESGNSIRDARNSQSSSARGSVGEAGRSKVFPPFDEARASTSGRTTQGTKLFKEKLAASGLVSRGSFHDYWIAITESQ